MQIGNTTGDGEGGAVPITLTCASCGERCEAGEAWNLICHRCWLAARNGWTRRLAKTPDPIVHTKVFRKTNRGEQA
jgi:hypothetical protein